jgi:two-component system response regulator FixJ
MVLNQGREITPVLIVDDDEAVRRSLQFLLKLDGLDVRLFNSAESLLAETSMPGDVTP